MRGGGLWQATKSLCGPIVDVAPAWPTIPYPRDWSIGCIAFNQSVLSFLSEHPNINRVVLGSVYAQYTRNNAAALIKTERDGYVEQIDKRSAIIGQFRETIERIQALGKEVVIVGPTPATGFDIGLCYERKATGAPIFGPNRDCQLSASAARDFRAHVDSVLKEVAAKTGVRLVNLADYLCDDAICRTEIDGVPLYRDAGHLSELGSRKVMAKTGVGAAILGGASSDADSKTDSLVGSRIGVRRE
ncbi:SGNH hydrolase domain-containing protein [Hyphomicrobium zavarzinii]|uniref:SGNH hydrolase domain-containing protein n=1 Tax=Hyphomicrobium zavarzinii TaxID=48292 RepID=UPI002472F890|nr:SGNH hydrolase domain-containing protein [Hyphomicrobium zavarzinii]